jgi:hypothetical protein
MSFDGHMMAAEGATQTLRDERPAEGTRRRRRQPRRGATNSIGARVAMVAVLLVCGEAHLAPVRWWRSSQVASELVLTATQSDALDLVYQQLIPAGQTVSLDVMRLTERIADAIRDRNYDDELLRATGALVRARDEQCELRRQVYARAVAVLQPSQQRHLSRLVAARQIIN